ncbi:protein of unknown function [Xenorhabdus poinarii G6]|uniref:Uncharacterized protein n=1 Tax=Xenorhabdus poinarii G6 TaxID=1354304 RepID=A0A068R525_9GAMM|nr:protein of unknown function [Xenorhabdus poinarii G6]
MPQDLNHGVHNRQQWVAAALGGEPVAGYVAGDKDPMLTWVHPKTDKILLAQDAKVEPKPLPVEPAVALPPIGADNSCFSVPHILLTQWLHRWRSSCAHFRGEHAPWR